MKLLKWLLSVVAVAVAIAGVVYLILTRAEQILDRMEYAMDRIRCFFYEFSDRFFTEEDFCECCCCTDGCEEAEAAAECAECAEAEETVEAAEAE